AVMMFSEAGEAVQRLFRDEGNEIIKNLEKRITERISRFIDLEASLDFEPPDVRADLAGKTLLELDDGFVKTSPDHQGHGAQRALILSLLEMLTEESPTTEGEDFTRGVILLIEEPEIYMHPQMCRKMRDVLLMIARTKIAKVICTTHSPVFIDLADRHDGIVIFKRNGNNIETIQRVDDLFGEGNVASERARLRMLLNFDPSVNEVFFSREVCLVEGDCEKAAIDAIARYLESKNIISFDKYLLRRRELVIVNCRGKWTIKAFQQVLNGFEINYRIVHDRDDEGEEGANAAILELLNEQEERRLLHDPNFEQQIFGQEWSSDKPWRVTRTISNLDEMPDDLFSFFEFVLGVSVSSLAPD
ncbi:ATP-dependent endonuclease, partial [Chloroflexota bacterium]